MGEVLTNPNQTASGSLADVARREGKSLSAVLPDVVDVVMIDISGSMVDDVAPNRTAYDAACDELKRMQFEAPGTVAVIEFGSSAFLRSNGVPRHPNGTTNMAAALRLARKTFGYNRDARFTIISDGQPDSMWSARNEVNALARTNAGPVSVVYAGRAEDSYSARNLKDLVRNGGSFSMATWLTQAPPVPYAVAAPSQGGSGLGALLAAMAILMAAIYLLMR